MTRSAKLGSDALYALHAGDVRLSDIPEELLGENAEAKRQAWLEERLSDKSKDWLAVIPTLEDFGPDRDGGRRRGRRQA